MLKNPFVIIHSFSKVFPMDSEWVQFLFDAKFRPKTSHESPWSNKIPNLT